jgi:hypothetical protein
MTTGYIGDLGLHTVLASRQVSNESRAQVRYRYVGIGSGIICMGLLAGQYTSPTVMGVVITPNDTLKPIRMRLDYPRSCDALGRQTIFLGSTETCQRSLE